MARVFKQVDVFTAQPYRGNPVAVVLDGSGLTTDQMQAFTDWTNLSEATFLLPPQDPAADYRLRIFCPGRELPFAGHPTLGSCHAWLESGGRPRATEIVQECGVGLVRVRRGGQRLAFAAPPVQRGGPLDDDEVSRIAVGLGIEPHEIVAHAWCDNGPPWRAVMLRTAACVLGLRPDPAALGGCFTGVVAPHASQAGPPVLEVRAFFPGSQGLLEDPVTGSLNAALGQWLLGSGLVAGHAYVAHQGTALGRAGRVHVERERSGTVWVGGDCVTCLDGVARL